MARMIETKMLSDGEIIIRIPASYVRHSVSVMDYFEDGARVTNTKTFCSEILRTLNQETEDGTTLIHTMLDSAIEEAVEQGAEGIHVYDD